MCKYICYKWSRNDTIYLELVEGQQLVSRCLFGDGIAWEAFAVNSPRRKVNIMSAGDHVCHTRVTAKDWSRELGGHILQYVFAAEHPRHHLIIILHLTPAIYTLGEFWGSRV